MRVATLILPIVLLSTFSPISADAKTSSPGPQCSVGYGKCMANAYKGLDTSLGRCSTKFSSDQPKFNKCYNNAIAALDKLKKACFDASCKPPETVPPAPVPAQ